MRLDELLDGIEILDLSNVYPDTEVSKVTADSRDITPGSIFVAIPGTKVDGHEYITRAVEAGAAVVIQTQPLDAAAIGSFVRVTDSRRAYGELCARLAGHPSRRLRVIGVTGTNGKTSTALIAAHLLNSAGHKCAVLGTLGLRAAGAAEFDSTGLTTPDAGVLQRILVQLADSGHTHLVMEVSSHALAQERVAGVEFAGAVFTNLTQDHFDFHGTLDAYFEAKALLFTQYLSASQGYAVVNRDDPAGAALLERCGGVCLSYGAAEQANLVLQEIAITASGTDWTLVLKNGVWPAQLDPGVNTARLHTPLAGRYNAYNCTAAAGVVLLEGLTLAQVAGALASFPGVPGRLQRVDSPAGVNVYVDYAHTPDALLNVLSALRELRSDGARIITVFGCGGDRDPDKRPKMGAAAQLGSDALIVTSDNPRSEDPEAIIDQIMEGIELNSDESVAAAASRRKPVTPASAPVEDGGKLPPPLKSQLVMRESDRRSAIRLALSMARPGDIVLIAGKGHEDYQILSDRTIHFSDAEEVESYYAAGSYS